MNKLTLTALTALLATSALSLAQPVRFAHVDPDAPSLDVYLDGQLLAQNASFATVTPYAERAGGLHTLKVTRRGEAERVLYQGRVNLAGAATTLAAWNDGHGLKLTAFTDTVASADPSLPRVRAYNLSPRQRSVNVGEVDGPSLASALGQGQVSPQAVMGQNLRTFGFTPASDGGTPLGRQRALSGPQWMDAGRSLSLFLTSNEVGEDTVIAVDDQRQ